MVIKLGCIDDKKRSSCCVEGLPLGGDIFAGTKQPVGVEDVGVTAVVSRATHTVSSMGFDFAAVNHCSLRCGSCSSGITVACTVRSQ